MENNLTDTNASEQTDNFPNLFNIYESTKHQAKQFSNVKNTSEILEPFKTELTKIYAESHTPLSFYSGYAETRVTAEPDSGIIFIPNPDFYMAGIVYNLAKTIRFYASIILESLSGLPAVDNAHGEIAGFLSDLRGKNINDPTIADRLSLLRSALKTHNERDLSDNQVELLIRSVLDINAWGGGKTINRGDAYVSSIYRALNVVQSKSSLHDCLGKYLSNPSLGDTASAAVTQLITLSQNEVKTEKQGEYNLIVSGAPGTGKSYSLQEKINNVMNEEEQNHLVFRQTLYPDYSYNDFVGQIMPVKYGDDISYDFVPSVFTLALKAAYDSLPQQKPVFLVLEELTRANAAAIFGDLFQLLDRDEDGISEYGINNQFVAQEVYGDATRKIKLPSNLYIWCTVNSNDQNVFSLDTAFKRRFSWQYVSPDDTNGSNNPDIVLPIIVDQEVVVQPVKWYSLYQALNTYITEVLELPEDKQIGAYFIKFPANADAGFVTAQVKNKLLQYLWDDINSASITDGHIFNSRYKGFSKLFNDFDRTAVFAGEFYNILNQTR